jgi:hypothetical protein
MQDHSHWIGNTVRRKLQLKTEKRHGSYVIASTEGSKLARLFERQGISSPRTWGTPGTLVEMQNLPKTQSPLQSGGLERLLDHRDLTFV